MSCDTVAYDNDDQGLKTVGRIAEQRLTDAEESCCLL